jgi:arsenate reductase (thioredoxin)
MAELWGRHLYPEQWHVASAGTAPAQPNPLMLKVMAEAGVSTQEARSVSVSQYENSEWDLVVTLCHHAADNCPQLTGAKRLIHVPFPDPAHAKGSEQEILRSFRKVRDQIRQFVLDLNCEDFSGLSHTTSPID